MWPVGIWSDTASRDIFHGSCVIVFTQKHSRTTANACQACQSHPKSLSTSKWIYLPSPRCGYKSKKSNCKARWWWTTDTLERYLDNFGSLKVHFDFITISFERKYIFVKTVKICFILFFSQRALEQWMSVFVCENSVTSSNTNDEIILIGKLVNDCSIDCGKIINIMHSFTIQRFW